MTKPEVWTKEQAKQYLAGNARLGKKKRAHKYGAKAVVVDGITFPSTAEGNRYSVLKLRHRAGEITMPILQPRFVLYSPDVAAEGAMVPVAEYVADFQYTEWQVSMATALGAARQGIEVVEDVKGVLTKVYRLKIKLFKAQYPALTFREIKQPSRRRRKRKAPKCKVK
jgi:hypothetical protein